MYYNTVLDAIGNTPLVKLSRMSRGLRPTILVKLEYFNPGGSVKDRIGIRMIEDAERKGLLKPGGTIIEGTSGNTGIGLALAAVIKGYKAIFTTTDKQSREKIDLLKAYGAEVVVCPTAVEPDDPRSYYSVAKRLNSDIPNSYYPNQYYNPENPKSHYETTGPEIWEQTEGKVDVLVAGMGTGGTITGAGKFLKEKKSSVRVVGVDPVGSLFHEYFHTGRVGTAHPYKVEGIGEDIFPSTLDFAVLDDVLQVTDKDSFLTARKITREEGIFIGGSGGSAVWGALQVAKNLDSDKTIVVIIPEGGQRNLGKVYNDEWMKENRFLEPPIKITAGDILRKKSRSMPKLIWMTPNTSVGEALKAIKDLEISQIPVMEEGRLLGSVQEDRIIDLLMTGKDLNAIIVREIMDPPFPVVKLESGIEQISAILGHEAHAILVESNGSYEIITKYDLVHSML